jgi:hypothetical protein
MVGLFHGLIKTIKQAKAELVVIEKNEQLIQKYSDLPISMDATKLSKCNKPLKLTVGLRPLAAWPKR